MPRTSWVYETEGVGALSQGAPATQITLDGNLLRVARVLLCDDAVAYGTLFEHWMREAGVGEVTQANTGARALVLAERLQPRVMVLDHLLPDGTSDQLLPRLRAAAPQARVLLISGLPDDKLAEAATASGADGHVGKWATPQVMRDAVLALMN